jgi:hypothetical protein
MKKLVAILICCTTCVAATDIKRPNSDTDYTGARCVGTFVAGDSLPLAYDTSLTTSSSLEIDNCDYACHGSWRKTRIITGWSKPTVTYTSLLLSVKSSCTALYEADSLEACTVSYSTDAGTTWHGVNGASAWFTTTTTVNLSPSTDLTKLRVAACVSAEGGSNGPNEADARLDTYDVETQGTY